MKIDFTSLEAEPLVYFVQHSTVFVVALGVVFFLMGLWTGASGRGRERRRHRQLLNDFDALQGEVTQLRQRANSPLADPPLAIAPAPPVAPAFSPAVISPVKEPFLVEQAVPSTSPTSFPQPASPQKERLSLPRAVVQRPAAPASAAPSSPIVRPSKIVRRPLFPPAPEALLSSTAMREDEACAAPAAAALVPEPFVPDLMLPEEESAKMDELLTALRPSAPTNLAGETDEPGCEPFSFLLSDEDAFPGRLDTSVPQDSVEPLKKKEPGWDEDSGPGFLLDEDDEDSPPPSSPAGKNTAR